MAENLTFHFEGQLADAHKMNFYEAARFQYAASRLMVKLLQFRHTGRFVHKITNNSNFDVTLLSQEEGSFGINIENPEQNISVDDFIQISLADLLAYVSERIVEKLDSEALEGVAAPRLISPQSQSTHARDERSLETEIAALLEGDSISKSLPSSAKDLVRRRAAEIYREKTLLASQSSIARIDVARSQKLVAMAAPLISEMATALRRSADTLEITTNVDGRRMPVFYLDQDMAREIETAIVDEEITPILGDITQFNKDNGWGKIKIENGQKTVSFSIPYDILPKMKQILIDSMKTDMVYLQTYFVRDRAGDVKRLIAVGILQTPSI